MGRWTKRFDFIAEEFCGTDEDWMDAVEAIGVRPAYYNGLHRAYLGKTQPCWTNATVAVFDSRQYAEEWCKEVNKIFEID